MAAFAATLVAHALWLPNWIAVLFAALMLARWVQRRRYARAWPGWIKFPLLLGLLALIVMEFGNPLARQAGTACLLGLTALKLIESERRRDGLLVISVCFFLISVQFLFNQGLWISLYMLIPSMLGFLALNEISAPPGTRGGMVDRLGTVGREMVVLLAVALPLTLFMFLTVPRLSEPLWGTRDNRWSAKTGLSETMSPGSITELLGDDTPVMRVNFYGQAPNRALMYWRGPVLWRFDGVEWTMHMEYQSRLDGALDGPQTGAPGDLRYEVALDPTERRWLFLLDRPTGFPEGSRRTMDGQVLRAKPVMDIYAFSAASELGAPVPVTALPIEQRRQGLVLPPGLNPRSAELARSWQAELGTDRMQLAQRALRYFREEPFSYQLSPLPLLSRHRMDEFLFETREGFCEHYAAAFVVLMRQAGVPARVVTGYQGAQFNSAGGYYVVRNSDAHAWAEILIEDVGWVRIDPTAAVAPERIELGSDSSRSGGSLADGNWLRQWRDRLDAVQAWWNRTLMRFDASRQRDFFAGMGIDNRDWKQIALWTGVGLTAIALLGALLFLRDLLPRRLPPGERAFRRFLQALARERRIVRGASEGPVDFGERAAELWPERASHIRAVCNSYARMRYGSGDPAQGAAHLTTAVQVFLQQPEAQRL